WNQQQRSKQGGRFPNKLGRAFKHRLELVKLPIGCVAAGKACREFQLTDEWIERAVGVIGRAKELETGGWDHSQAVAKGLRHSRFAHSRRCRQENDLAVTFVSTLPALTDHADLVAPANQRRHALTGSGREAADGAVLADDCPDVRRLWNSLQGLQSEIFVVERGA